MLQRKIKLAILTVIIVMTEATLQSSGQSSVQAQDSSLLRIGPQGLPFPGAGAGPSQGSGTRDLSPSAPLMLDRVSWTHQPPPQIRTFRKHDPVTIRVDEITRMQSLGNAQTRRTTLYEAALTDWIKLANFRLRPDPADNGEPTIGTESTNNFRAQSSLATSESLAFNITATVVDIRPNGLLVLEARKQIRVNDNLYETSLTGICRSQDIAPDNVILSKDLVDLEIRKEDQGQVRDGYKRGWFQRWFDRVQPF